MHQHNFIKVACMHLCSEVQGLFSLTLFQGFIYHTFWQYILSTSIVQHSVLYRYSIIHMPQWRQFPDELMCRKFAFTCTPYQKLKATRVQVLAMTNNNWEWRSSGLYEDPDEAVMINNIHFYSNPFTVRWYEMEYADKSP